MKNMLLLVMHLLLGTDCRIDEQRSSRSDGYYMAVAKVPRFFTPGRCADAGDARLEVFATPARARKVADIRWGKRGDAKSYYCVPLVYLPRQSCPRGELPVLEDDYEESALVVVERAGKWVRVRLDQGTGWIRLSNADEVVPYEEMVIDRLAELTDDWDGRIYSRPGGRARRLTGVSRPSVTVEDSRRVDGKLWFRVRLFAASPCETRKPREIAEGWVRGYSQRRQPTVLHFSRGC